MNIVGGIGVVLIIISLITLYISYFLMKVGELLASGWVLAEIQTGRTILHGWVQRNSVNYLPSLRSRNIDGFIEIRNKNVIYVQLNDVVRVVRKSDTISYIRHGRYFKSNI